MYGSHPNTNLPTSISQYLSTNAPSAKTSCREGENKLRGRGEREEERGREKEREVERERERERGEGGRRGREEREIGEGERRGRGGKVIHLSETDKAGEDEGPKSHSENTVNEVATKHRENHIGPRVQRIEESILCH